LGKIIGGGLPIGAYGGRSELLDLVAPVGPVYQAGTLSGHPVVMAAGEATLSQLTPAVYAELETRAGQLANGLRRDDTSVAQLGSLLTVFFRDGVPANYSEARSSDPKAFARFFAQMREAGVLLPPSQFEAWFLSSTHDSQAIEATLEAAGRAGHISSPMRD
ncbi:MAG: aspartate aminotransferase family protein, partial [Candidatus Dormibacteraceae bacterium]